MRPVEFLLLAVFLVTTAWGLGNEENPHWMLRSDGEPDEEKCAICHDEDKNLLSSKEETCLSCHERTLHSGSEEHLRASAAQVQTLLPPKGKYGVEFPLAEDGRMYCGTCHLFHDPRVDEVTLAAPRTLPSEGIAWEIRQAVERQVRAILALRPESEVQWSFAQESTGFLRLPLTESELCVACHEREGNGR